MQIEAFCLCDAATAEPSGKLNILGTFDTIWFPSMPAVYPQCTIALRIRFEAIERGEHRIAVNFVNSDGQHLVPPTNGVINITFSNEEQRSAAANLVLNIQGLKLDGYGEYSIDLAIDGRAMANLPLFIKQR
jgi:hypothetical protein